MELLPLELHIHHIFNHIDTPSIVRSKRVSKDWKELIEQVLPYLDINVSGNEYISDDDLGVFSKNKVINLSHCLNLRGNTMWWIWPEKLNLDGCTQLSDNVYKYLGSVKELNINDIYNPYEHRIKNEIFLKLEKLSVGSCYGIPEFEMFVSRLTNLTIKGFHINSDLFYRHKTLKVIHFITCYFGSDFYYTSNAEYCKNIEFVIFDNCCDQEYYDDSGDYDDLNENIIVFVMNYLPDQCMISYHGKVNDKRLDINNVTKEEFIKQINYK